MCVILQHTFLHDRNELRNESFNAITTRHSKTPQDFDLMCFCLVMAWCAHLDSRCQPIYKVQWRVSCPQQTTFCLESSICTTKKDSNPCEISRTGASKTLQPCPRHTVHDHWWCVSLAHTQIVHMHVVLLSLLCIHPNLLLDYTKLQLGCIDCYYYLHTCELVAVCSQV